MPARIAKIRPGVYNKYRGNCARVFATTSKSLLYCSSSGELIINVLNGCWFCRV